MNQRHPVTVPKRTPCGCRIRLNLFRIILAAGFATGIAQAASPGSVVAWGHNGFGQTNVPVAAQSGVTTVAAGDAHTVALKTNGSVVAWGNNGNGQTTVPFAAQSGVTAIAAGGFHTVALKTNGSVVAWGWNQYGQTTVPVAAQSGVTAIAAGREHTVALKDDGWVVAWGRNFEGQTTVPGWAQGGVTAIAAGYYHTVALENGGWVGAWGWNQYGQTTVPLAARDGVMAIAAIAAGGSHTVAVLTLYTGVPDDFNPGIAAGLDDDPWVSSLAVQADGKILVGGEFHTLGGQPRYGIGRLNPDGTLDSTFNPGPSGSVSSLALQADGKILVAGFLITSTGIGNSIGRFNADGTLDSTFNPGADPWGVDSLALQADGKILVGGGFTTLGGQPRTNIGRLNADGTLDSTFNPGAGGIAYPRVSSLALQADGKILVGGYFTTLGGQPRTNIGRLNGDGTLDSTFNLGATGASGFSGSVYSLALQADGKILVGGWFTTLGGQPRDSIGRLNGDGTLDSTFNAGTDGAVGSLALQADGKILVGGGFTTLGGQPRKNIGRLNNTGPATQTLGYDGSTITWLRGGTSPEVWRTTFEHSADEVNWTFLGAGTRISDGWQLDGVSLPAETSVRARGYVAGSHNASGWFVEGYHGVPVLLSQPASRTNAAGTSASFRVVAGATGALNYQWRKNGMALVGQGNTAGANSAILTLSQVLKADEGGYSVVLSNGFGSHTSVVATLTVIDPFITGHPAGTNRNLGESVTFNVMAAGTPPLSYQWYHGGTAVPGAVGSSLALPVLSRADAGRYAVVVSNAHGSVTSAPALLTVNVATLDSTFNPGAGDRVESLAVQSDGKILVGGRFDTLGGQPRAYLGRLNANGTLDSTFNPGISGDYSYVFSLAVQADGKILVGGSFTTLGGQPRASIGRLNADGTLDSTFDPGVSGSEYPIVDSLALQADGKILVGGFFDSLGGQARASIGRLNADGTLDSTFNPGASWDVNSMAVQADGKILVGGRLDWLGGQPRNNIGRLNADGTLDSTFNPGAGGNSYPVVNSLALQTDGKVLVGGYFTTLGGQPRNGIARLNADGTLDSAFNPGAGGGVDSLALQADGKILVGGGFGILGGQPRNNIGRLNNTDPATQILGYDGTTITWLRGGTSPEVWHTTFEHSSNGLDWTLLGAGTRIPDGWQLTGVSLPPDGTLRARGQVAGGYQNASGWFVERILSAPWPIRLRLLRDGATVVLNWTGGQGPYQVQQTADLAQAGAWQNVGVPVQTNSMSLPIGTGTLFLRVRGQ